ncbi:hypothetical protein F4803DRAFT_547113 [Xylaria telfairii]|nr:hypothetical protein F4803DRAFT_547113 [Xylaria telfairii]
MKKATVKNSFRKAGLVSEEDNARMSPAEVKNLQGRMRRAANSSDTSEDKSESPLGFLKANRVETEDDKNQPLFAIDTSSTPVDLATVRTVGDEDIEDGTPEGELNRKARRRLKLIEREREKITRRIMDDVKVKLENKEGMIQEALDRFTMRMDKAAEIRNRNSATRKKKKHIRNLAKRAARKEQFIAKIRKLDN